MYLIGAIMSEPTPPTVPISPETQGLFDKVQRQLKERAKQHNKISYMFLVAMVLSVAAAVISIAFSRTLLGSDIEGARRNEELLGEFNRQKSELDTERTSLNAEAAGLRNRFLKYF